MNHTVPDFEANEDCLIPEELHKKSSMGGGNEDIMELLWHNGQVVMHSQNQGSGGNKRSSLQTQLEYATMTTTSREVRSPINRHVNRHTEPCTGLFMQEDEMASWLRYPSDDNSLEEYLFNNDLLYPTPPVTTASVTLHQQLPPPPSVVTPSSRPPPVPPFRSVEKESRPLKYKNFMHFSRPIKSFSPELGHSSSTKMTLTKTLSAPSTILASNKTPTTDAPESRASRVSDKHTPMNIGQGVVGVAAGGTSTSSARREIEPCEMSMASSSNSDSNFRSTPPLLSDDKKRKGRYTDNPECHNKDVEFEYHDTKKQSYGGSTSTKRSRAAEVHNLSERKRRDRINEKMKALQELIPRCNKSDKASMLDEAIEYLKSLQMQVQMMSMGCSMVPMMFPGVQQYVPPMAMGMGMNQTMVPYPAIFQGTPNHSNASHAANITAPMMSSYPQHNQNQTQVPTFVDPFQQYIGLHQSLLPLPQNQGDLAAIATKPNRNKDVTIPDHRQTG